MTFNTKSGSYEYKIGKDGIIQERNYKRTSDEEETVETPVETKKKKQKQKLRQNQRRKKQRKKIINLKLLLMKINNRPLIQPWLMLA